jgi:hypothetical protein
MLLEGDALVEESSPLAKSPRVNASRREYCQFPFRLRSVALVSLDYFFVLCPQMACAM